MRVLLANPRGFCAGVDRAIATVEQLLEVSDEPVFVRHEIVHNRAVVGDLRAKGAVFVEEINEIPPGALAIISAHGAPPAVFRAAEARGLRLVDATCPLVSKVHIEVSRHARHNRSVVVIGHRDHVEVRGIVGYYTRPDRGDIYVVEDEIEAASLEVETPERVGYVTQTTLAVDQTRRIIDVLQRRFPGLIAPHARDICYATQNRQEAVRELAKTCGLIIIIGAPHSSNSQRMCEVAQAAGAVARLIEDADDIDPTWLEGCDPIGMSASASAPEHLIVASIARLRALHPNLVVENVGAPEGLTFRLPFGVADGATPGREPELHAAY